MIKCSCFFNLIYFPKKTNMWKAVGSIHSGQNRSIRSNHSRLENQFQSFHLNNQNRSVSTPPKRDQSFCYQYLLKKREDHNLTTKSRVKSQKNIRYDETNKEDIFTSIRNVLGNQINDSLITFKQKDQPDQSKMPEPSKINQNYKEQNEKTKRMALNRMNNLRKQQKKLKKTLEVEFMTFKNMFYQIQDYLHSRNQAEKKIEQLKKQNQNVDIELLKGIVNEAISIQKYFFEMDRKKMTIMDSLISD